MRVDHRCARQIEQFVAGDGSAVVDCMGIHRAKRCQSLGFYRCEVLEAF